MVSIQVRIFATLKILRWRGRYILLLTPLFMIGADVISRVTTRDEYRARIVFKPWIIEQRVLSGYVGA
jgi:hypothetical protein